MSTFLLSWLLLLTLEMEGDDRLRSWIGYAVLWGFVALTNTAELAWLPFSGCWLAYHLYRGGKRFVVPVVASAVVFWIVLTPWLVRNYVVFGQVVFIRDNFGNELRAGNNPLSEGLKVVKFDSGRDPYLLSLYKEMGEPAINAQQEDVAKAWIANHPGRFFELCVHRFWYFWGGTPHNYGDDPFAWAKQIKNHFYALWSLLALAGLVLAIKRRIHGVFLFATILLFYPLTYYITVPEPRYRHAIEPQMLMLSVYLIWALVLRFLPQRQKVQDEVMV